MVKRDCGEKQSGIALILLVSFVLGSLLSIVYKDVINTFLFSRGTSHRVLLTQCIALSCVLAQSVNGRVFFPGLCSLFGIAIETELESFCAALSQLTAKCLINTLNILIMVPVFFLVSGWGMSKSIELGRILRRTEFTFTSDNLFSFTIMFIGLALLLFGQNIMLI